LVAIDGSKFLAVNNRSRNFSREKLKRVLKDIDEKIQRYLAELDQQDESLPPATSAPTEALKVKLDHLRKRQAHFQSLEHQLEQSGEPQLSLTDPDSRAMLSHQRIEVGYNVQIAVDSKHKLVVAHEVTKEVTDQNLLATMASRAKEVLAVDHLAVVTDSGYYAGAEVKQCLAAGVTPYIAKPRTSVNQHRGLYTKDDFRYDARQDSYRCPQGAELEFRFETVEDGRPTRYYLSSACKTCEARTLCTRNKAGRRIKRWRDEHLLEEMAQRVTANPAIMKLRQALAEHPFGTLKRGMNQGYFLLRRLVKVRGEMSLSLLAYNLKRVITILGVEKLIAAVT
jgi:macrodomain Ter protein organizer (MatP/YcbG family)